MINESQIWQALEQVIDPEIGCSVVDLGLIYDLQIVQGKVLVKMTLTTRGCPMSQSIAQGVQWALLGVDGVDDAAVELVWDPPWTPEMMTERGRAPVNPR